MLLAQGVATCVVGLVGATFGWQTGVSAWLGGLICWLPSAWFALRAFRARGARAADRIVRGFYAAEFGKVLLTIASFAVVFVRVPEIDALALFAGYAGVHTMHWIVPLWDSRQESLRTDR